MRSGTFVGISRGKKRHIVSVHLFIYCQRSFACPIFDYNGYAIELHYTPQISYLYFTGTGKISILFYAFPFGAGAQPMILLSLIFFYLGLFLYCSFIIILGLKYIFYPDRWSSLLWSPTASLYAGCFPMGAATLINVAVIVINGQLNYGGKSFLYFIWAIWWLDVFVSFVCCWVGVHAMYVSDRVFYPLCT